MPYIKRELRKDIDKIIDDLARAIKEKGTENRAGVLNYSVSLLLKKLYDVKYSEVNEAMGALECIKQEYYRRVAAPYEDIKIKENGDVY
ncbi:MAG: hypothetical protein JXA66_06805 [Oligoflexia bacterium]|nr:hypothetical protein [Oligoflexia bacterium]